MADGKWISDLTASTSLADAACRVLSVRLDAVRQYLPLAMRRAEENIEHVHQLRVSTRRAGAALEIFALCLPDRDYRRARKALRRIRRAAGEARDWDVFLENLHLEGRPSPRRRSVLDFLIGYGLSRRVAAQEHLAQASPNHPFDFDRLVAETVAAIQKPKARPELRNLLDLAQPMLSSLLHELHQATLGDLHDYDHLHQVRIIGKRLRYAMEIFVDCFGPAFKDQLYSAVEAMQEILGAANDSHVASQRLAFLGDRVRVFRPSDSRRFRDGLTKMQRQHDQRLVAKRAEFLIWWDNWLQTGGETAFTALLLQLPEANGTPAAATVPAPAAGPSA